MNWRRYAVALSLLMIVVLIGCGDAQHGASTTPSSPQPSDVAQSATTAATATKATSTTEASAKSGLPSWPTALSLLETIAVMKERPQGYARSLFVHWIDADGDGCNTREEVLIAESSSVAQVDAFSCRVVEGDWFSPYDGVAYTTPAELDIDHLVPLKEAWDSGAWSWSVSQRRAFANDLSDSRPLVAVTASENRAKSDKDPSNWIPARRAFVCEYLADWIAVKAHWNLSMDPSEFGRIGNVLSQSCANVRVAPWGADPTATDSGASLGD